MKRNTWNTLMTGAVMLAASGCTEDPLASLRDGGPKRLALSASALTVNIRDSVPVTVTVQDAQGNPLTDAATATSSAPAIVSVSNASPAPLPQSKFFFKGLSFGQGYVKVTAGSVTDSIKVLAYPASVAVSGLPDSLQSGSGATLTATPRDAVGSALANIAPITWESDNPSIASLDSPGWMSSVAGKTPGVANILVTLPGKASTQVSVRVVPAPFAGSLSAAAGGYGNVVTATRQADELPFDDETTITVGGTPAFVTNLADPQISFALPPVADTGSNQVWFNNLGTDALARRASIRMTTSGVKDSYEPANDDPATAPVIAANGAYYFILHGSCSDPPPNPPFGFGEPETADAECDDFFRITNTTGAALTITATLDWLSDADVDMYVTDETVSVCENCDGVTGSNPEQATFTLPAGTTFLFWMNLYQSDGAFASVRLRISGLP